MPIVPEDPISVPDGSGIRVTRATHTTGTERKAIDIFFLCTVDVEEDQLVRHLFGGSPATSSRPYPPSYRRFYERSWPHAGQRYSIAACKASDQGALDVLTTLMDVYLHFAPKILCLVGIAGALDEDLKIGDVVVASAAYWYERGKDLGHRTDRELRMFRLGATQRNLVDAVLGDMRRKRQSITARLGTYGTGDKVIASELSAVRDFLRTIDRKVACVEMESGGFFQYFDVPNFKRETDVWLVVKGMSDGADAHKNDRNQPLAARNSVKVASVLAAQILTQLGLAGGPSEDHRPAPRRDY